jgi:hypothetical protein
VNIKLWDPCGIGVLWRCSDQTNQRPLTMYQTVMTGLNDFCYCRLGAIPTGPGSGVRKYPTPSLTTPKNPQHHRGTATGVLGSVGLKSTFAYHTLQVDNKTHIGLQEMGGMAPLTPSVFTQDARVFQATLEALQVPNVQPTTRWTYGGHGCARPASLARCYAIHQLCQATSHGRCPCGHSARVLGLPAGEATSATCGSASRRDFLLAAVGPQ